MGLMTAAKSLRRVRLLATPWTAAHQAPLSMGFSRQEHWSGVPLPSPTYDRIASKLWYFWKLGSFWCWAQILNVIRYMWVLKGPTTERTARPTQSSCSPQGWPRTGQALEWGSGQHSQHLTLEGGCRAVVWEVFLPRLRPTGDCYKDPGKGARWCGAGSSILIRWERRGRGHSCQADLSGVMWSACHGSEPWFGKNKEARPLCLLQPRNAAGARPWPIRNAGWECGTNAVWRGRRSWRWERAHKAGGQAPRFQLWYPSPASGEPRIPELLAPLPHGDPLRWWWWGGGEWKVQMQTPQP